MQRGGSLAAGVVREAWSRYELDLVGGEDGRSFGDECCDDRCLVVFAPEESHRLVAQVLITPLPQRVQRREQVGALLRQAVLVPLRAFLVEHAFEDPLFDESVETVGGDRAWQASFNVAAGASPFATYACVDTWLTDFRDDLPKIDVPVLVVHGTEDRILPFEATAKRLPGLVDNLELVPVEGGPHNIGWTHPDEVNHALLRFLDEGTAVGDQRHAAAVTP